LQIFLPLGNSPYGPFTPPIFYPVDISLHEISPMDISSHEHFVL
jgi:hypothetical protein